MAATIGTNFIFGVHSPKPLQGFPGGRIKLKQRHDGFVRAFVKSADGIREFLVKEADGFWIPGIEVGRNVSKPAPFLTPENVGVEC